MRKREFHGLWRLSMKTNAIVVMTRPIFSHDQFLDLTMTACLSRVGFWGSSGSITKGLE